MTYVNKDRVEFESKEIADAWSECLDEAINNLKKREDGFYICPHCNEQPVSMPGYMYSHFKLDVSAVYLFEKFPTLKGRKFWGSGLWSRGTYYATVGGLSEKAIREYLKSQ